MGYEVFEKKTPRMGIPMMSFSKIGQLTFNQPAARVLKQESFETILLLWDPDAKRIALKATDNQNDPRAYKIRYNGKGNGASFSVKTFLDYSDIDYSQRRSMPIEIKPLAEMFLEATIPDRFFKSK